MRKLAFGFTAALLTLALSACTLTFLPGEEPTPAAQQEQPRVVTGNSKPQAPVIVIPTHPRNEQITYGCSGTRLLVRYLDNYDSANIFYDGQWNTLQRDRSVNGEVYANNTYTWTADGRKGSLQKNGTVVVRDCSY